MAAVFLEADVFWELEFMDRDENAAKDLQLKQVFRGSLSFFFYLFYFPWNINY